MPRHILLLQDNFKDPSMGKIWQARLIIKCPDNCSLTHSAAVNVHQNKALFFFSEAMMPRNEAHLPLVSHLMDIETPECKVIVRS